MVLRVWQEQLGLVEKQLFLLFFLLQCLFQEKLKNWICGSDHIQWGKYKTGKRYWAEGPKFEFWFQCSGMDEFQWISMNHQNFEAGWYLKKKKALSMLWATQYLVLSWVHSMPAHGHTALIRKHLGSTEPKVALWTHECLPCRRRTVRGPKCHGSSEVSTPSLGSQARVIDMDNFRFPSTQV